MRVVGCIVLFNNKLSMVEKAINSFLLNQNNREIIIVDHSAKSSEDFFLKKNVRYIHNPENPGYGAGINLAFKESLNPDYFFIMNPDILILGNSINILIEKLYKDSSIGLITGKVLNQDGTIQKLIKNDPNFSAFLTRRLPFLENIPYFSKKVKEFVPDNDFYTSEKEVQIVSGCFMGISGETFKKLNGFDERYFLYFEDFDLCRRIREIGLKIIYTPEAEIMHLWQRKAHYSIRHLFYFGRSMIRYFWNI